LRVAILGAGKIGRIIAKALVDRGYGEVVATGRSEATLREAEKLGAKATRDNRKAVSEADVVIISVKPYHFPQLLREVGSDAWGGKLVVSIMAGVKIATLRKRMPGAEVYRAMPNVCAAVGKSSTAVAYDTSPGERARVVEELLSALGKVYWLPEELLDAWTGLVGSGPAYVAELIDGFVLGGLAVGLPRELALASVLDVLEGTAELLRRRGVHPSQMRDEVITPKGTTIAGISVLERRAVKSILIEAVVAATKRSSSISESVDKTLETLSDSSG